MGEGWGGLSWLSWGGSRGVALVGSGMGPADLNFRASGALLAIEQEMCKGFYFNEY